MYKRFQRIPTTRLIMAAAAVIAVYFLVAGGINTIRARQLREQESRLEADIGDLQSRYDRLEALKRYLSSDEYIESVARRELGLVKQGEVGIVAISTVPTPTPEPGADGDSSLWWDTLIR